MTSWSARVARHPRPACFLRRSLVTVAAFVKLASLVGFLLGSFVALSSSSARNTKEFDGHVAEGKRLYTNRDFDGAFAEFEAAYRIEPDPRLLLNMGRCRFNTNRPKDAVEYYNLMLKNPLPEDQRREVAKSLFSAQKLLEQQNREREDLQKANATDKQSNAALINRDLSSPVAASQAPPPKPLYRKAWFWGIIGGVSAVGLALGLGLGLGLRQSNTGPVDVIQ